MTLHKIVVKGIPVGYKAAHRATAFTKSGRRFTRTIKSPERLRYDSWRQLALIRIREYFRAARIKLPLPSPVAIGVKPFVSSFRGDWTNIRKGAEDSLVSAGVILGDTMTHVVGEPLGIDTQRVRVSAGHERVEIYIETLREQDEPS